MSRPKYGTIKRCAKCGCEMMMSRWSPGEAGCTLPKCDSDYHAPSKVEHVLRICTCCAYSWEEMPLDAIMGDDDGQ